MIHTYKPHYYSSTHYLRVCVLPNDVILSTNVFYFYVIVVTLFISMVSLLYDYLTILEYIYEMIKIKFV